MYLNMNLPGVASIFFGGGTLQAKTDLEPKFLHPLESTNALKNYQMLHKWHDKTQLLREMASLEPFHESGPMSISTSETFCPNTTKNPNL